MRASLLCLPCLLSLAPVASAEAVRVAVARGASLRVEGKALTVRTPGTNPGTAVASPLSLEMVGPFVSTGDVLEALLILEDATGALSVNGVPMAGVAQISTEKGLLLAVDVVDLERYVAAVVGDEVPADWPAAALEAQSIATRTYVLQKKHTEHADAPYDVESTVISQVYRGRASMQAPAIAAAQRTQGQVLTFGGELAEAFFFASCVGTTETASSAFGHAQPYLTAVSCGVPSERAYWKRTVPLATVAKVFQSHGLVKGEVKDLVIETRTSTGRVATVQLSGASEQRSISGNELRRILGYSTLPSLDFKVEKSPAGWIFTGQGSGHGVGLCQWCARDMAANGQPATEILEHFYPGTHVEPLRPALLAAKP